MPKDELDTVSDLRYSWKKLHKLATEVSDGLAKMQASVSPLHMDIVRSYCSTSLILLVSSAADCSCMQTHCPLSSHRVYFH